MSFSHLSHNGTLLPVEQGVISVTDVEYAYGFGVYESIRVAHGCAYFLKEHIERLFTSAQMIFLEHPFSHNQVVQWTRDLMQQTTEEAYNIKMLLIGAPKTENAQLYIFCSQPFFVDRQLYKKGATVMSVHVERPFPNAKTLNMLPSYLAYRQAKQGGHYDALLVNTHGEITEGTRTNFFAIQGESIFTPPAEEVLQGVTRKHVIEVAQRHNMTVTERQISLQELASYDGAILTSTSSKILPLRQIDQVVFSSIPPVTLQLMEYFDAYMQEYAQQNPY